MSGSSLESPANTPGRHQPEKPVIPGEVPLLAGDYLCQAGVGLVTGEHKAPRRTHAAHDEHNRLRNAHLR